MTNYAYAYAVIRESDGWCLQVKDTSNYIEDKLYIPLEEYNEEYLFKYYHPIPTAYGDFNGKWYTTNSHDVEWIPE